MRKISGIILLLQLFLFAGNLRAQDDIPAADSELWTGFTYKLKLSKKWRVEAEQQLRLNEDYSRFKSTFTEAGLRYKFTDFLNVKAQYRFTVNNEKRNEHRLSLDLNAEWDIADLPLDIAYRIRLQDVTVSYTGEKVTYVRNQLSFDYNLSKLVDPFVEYENFFRFNEKNEVRNHRYTFGLEWKISDNYDLQTYYRIDQERNVKRPERQYIIGLMLSYKMELRSESK